MNFSAILDIVNVVVHDEGEGEEVLEKDVLPYQVDGSKRYDYIVEVVDVEFDHYLNYRNSPHIDLKVVVDAVGYQVVLDEDNLTVVVDNCRMAVERTFFIEKSTD